MPLITLETIIHAPAEICFDLSRSIDLHMTSTEHTGEKAIAGRVSGLIGLGETVTWKAKHLGVWQTLTSKITAMDRPHYFVDEMTKGAFKSIYHEHLFESKGEQTIMTDKFRFETPFSFLGDVFNTVFLTRYLHDLLEKRNAVIKSYAESGKWKEILPVT
jgi:ligand-binding SRPBCC domain-containing protein